MGSKGDKREYRFQPCEVRLADGTERKRLVGTPILYDVETVIMGLFREVIRPGASKKTIQERDILATWQHDTAKPLGRKSRGTLKLQENAAGVDVVIDPLAPPETSWGRDAVNSVERGDVEGMSFAFEVPDKKYTWHDGTGGMLPLREIHEIKIWEVSPVTFPQYEQTSIAVRGWVPTPPGGTRNAEPQASEPTVVGNVTSGTYINAATLTTHSEPIAEPAQGHSEDVARDADERYRKLKLASVGVTR